jgi:hypothetical protein
MISHIRRKHGALGDDTQMVCSRIRERYAYQLRGDTPATDSDWYDGVYEGDGLAINTVSRDGDFAVNLCLEPMRRQVIFDRNSLVHNPYTSITKLARLIHWS